MANSTIPPHRPGPRIAQICAGATPAPAIAMSSPPSAANEPRVHGTLLEYDAGNVAVAQAAADQAGLSNLVIKLADASRPASYVDAVPADLVLMVGVFGNVSDGAVKQSPSLSQTLQRRGQLAAARQGASTDHRRMSRQRADQRREPREHSYDRAALDGPRMSPCTSVSRSPRCTSGGIAELVRVRHGWPVICGTTRPMCVPGWRSRRTDHECGGAAQPQVACSGI
jgi:hypothetical protein